MKKILVLLVLFVSIIGGCSCKKEDITRTSIYAYQVIAYLNKEGTSYTLVDPFGTLISFSGYDEDKINDAEDVMQEMVNKYHSLLDRNYYYKDSEGNLLNNIKIINESYGSGNSIVVDKIIIDILKEGIKYTKLSNGKFNIISGSIVDVWDSRFAITEKWHEDPTEEEIEEGMKCVPSISMIDDVLVIDDVNNTVTFNKFINCDNGASITLGALAKSYFVDKLSQEDEFKRVESSILNAGSSSILVKGKNIIREDNEWVIYLRDSLNRGNYALSVNMVEDGSLSTSSGDEKGYINDEGIRRHHIIDATSGIPNTYLLAASVISDSAMVADIATTTLMTMNSLEEIKEYLVSLKNLGINLKVLLQIEDNGNLKILVDNEMKKIVKNIDDNEYPVTIEEFSYGA